ncbi:MAG: dihydrodipicolinate synthase family protein [Proteobacteria bacterium]|nr:dihydrodipicolinate synthase family protein [Pseudomonadota bacterium]
MTADRIEGIVPILLSPFFEDGRFDAESMARQVEFNLEAGVHGLGLAIASEMFKFNEAERAQVIGATAAAIDKRTPLIVNVSAAASDLAAHYARLAQDQGADVLMVYPPTFLPAGVEEVIDYYRRVAGAVDIPIVLQDVVQAPISPAVALRIADACPNVKYIKVESVPVTAKVAAMTAAVGDRLTVFGGAGGGYFIEEMRRGARGTMPFSTQPSEFLEVWTLFQSGDHVRARQVFDTRIMAVNRLALQEADVFYHLHKRLFVRMGVFKSAYVRSPTMVLDNATRWEIEDIIEGILARGR